MSVDFQLLDPSSFCQFYWGLFLYSAIKNGFGFCSFSNFYIFPEITDVWIKFPILGAEITVEILSPYFLNTYMLSFLSRLYCIPRD